VTVAHTDQDGSVDWKPAAYFESHDKARAYLIKLCFYNTPNLKRRFNARIEELSK
jgi:hypothetical protein